MTRTLCGVAIAAILATLGCNSHSDELARQVDAEASAAAAIICEPPPVAPVPELNDRGCDHFNDAPVESTPYAPAIDWRPEAEAWRDGIGKRWLWVHISGEQCGPCVAVDHMLLEERVAAAAADLDCARLDVHDSRAAAYGAQAIPVDVFVDPTRKLMFGRQFEPPADVDELVERVRTRGGALP